MSEFSSLLSEFEFRPQESTGPAKQREKQETSASAMTTLELIYQERVSLLNRAYEHRLQYLARSLVEAARKATADKQQSAAIENAMRDSILTERDAAVRYALERLSRCQARAEFLQRSVDSQAARPSADFLAMEARCQRLEKLARNFEKELSDANAANRVLNAEVSRLSQSALASPEPQNSPDAQQLRQKVEALQKEITQTREENANLKKSSRALQLENREKDSSAAALSESLQSSSRASERLQARLEILNGAFEAAKRDAVKFQALAVEQRRNLENERGIVAQLREMVEVERRRAADCRASATEEIRSLEQKQREELENLQKSTRHELDRVQGEIRQLERERGDLGRRQEEEREKMRQKQENAKEQQKMAENLLEELKEKSRAEQERIHQESDYRLQQLKDSSASQARALQGSIETLTAENSELRAKILTLVDRSQADRSAAELWQEKFQRLENAGAAAQRNSQARLSEEREMRAAESAAMAREFERINEKYSEAQRRVQQAEGEINLRQQKLEISENERKEAKASAEAKTAELRALATARDQLEESITRLTEESQRHQASALRSAELAVQEAEHRGRCESSLTALLETLKAELNFSGSGAEALSDFLKARRHAVQEELGSLRSKISSLEASAALRSHEFALEMEIAKVQAAAPYKGEIEQLRAALKEFQAFHDAQLRLTQDQNHQQLTQQVHLAYQGDSLAHSRNLAAELSASRAASRADEGRLADLRARLEDSPMKESGGSWLDDAELAALIENAEEP